jgi:hypothetical protein
MINTLSAITDDPEAQQIAQQLRNTEGRLVDHYAGSRGMTEDHVRHTFGVISKRFIDARVRTFLPILIERAVRRELER